MRRRSVLLALPLLAAALGADWPNWRGPAQDGVGDRPQVTRWSATENVVWKAAVPGRGHASPVVVGGRIFLATADEKAKTQSVLAFDRATGKPLWSTKVHAGGFGRLNPKNSHASATPACDGTRVYSAFLHHDALHVTATDLDGKIAWQTRAGDFTSEHGYGSSPVLHDGRVLVNGDSLKGSFVAALDAARGTVAWKTDRPSTGRNGSYGTPVVAPLAGRPQLLLTGLNAVTGYDPTTGDRLWWCAGPAAVTGCTPAFDAERVYATGGYPEKELLAVRADGRGDVTKSHVAWRTTKGVAYVPSPLCHAGRLYVLTDGGVLTCHDAATGKAAWQERLPGNFTASLVLAGDLLLATNEAGRTYVLKAGPAYEPVATNDLGEGVMATPAAVDGRLYVRTATHLFCIGRP